MALSVGQVLTSIVEELGVSFALNDKVIPYSDVISEKGLLPAIARRADQVSTMCLGYGIGISFDEADNSILGVKVIFDNVTPQSLRLLCLIDVILDIISFNEDDKNVALDELLYD